MVALFFFLNTLIPSDDLFLVDLGATWTIPVFILFYFLAPLFFRLIRKYWIALIVFLLFFAATPYMPRTVYYFAPYTQLNFFLLGICVYFAEKEKKQDVFLSTLAVLILIMLIMNFDSMRIVTAFCFCILMVVFPKMKFPVPVSQISDFISKYSYEIYLIHPFVLEILLPNYINCGLPHVVIGIVTIAVTVLLSMINYGIIEKPFVILGKRLCKMIP